MSYMSKNNASLEVVNLKKSFGKLKVLDGVNFSVNSGEILALLGPNGAGKTTTINILSTLLSKDGGTAKVAGFDTATEGAKVRENIGLTGQFAAVDEYLTGRENIRLVGRLYHMETSAIEPRVTQLLEMFDLVAAADRPAKTYSGGMKRRLDLAMSLVADPKILFLDEPTTGLDPRSRLTLWSMIKDLANEGRTVLLTTQYMDEADFLANNIVVIDHGVVIAEGTPNQLKAKAGADRIEVTFTSLAELTKAEKVLKGTSDAQGLTFNIPAKRGMTTLKETLAQLEENKIKADTVSVRRPTLDDVFLALTGHSAADKKTKKEKKQ